MSEIKRVALNTLEPQKVNDKVIQKLCKTVRISVILPQSNEDNCPEYNYKDQLAAVVKKKVKQNKDSNDLENGLDPFGENDDDVRRIALEMEAKYGTGVTGGVPKKKRKDKKDDYADIGMGYDESDSFIDNTDGYDEIIPQNVTTLHGGFYVNSGALVFKTDDEASSNASSSASSSSGSSSSSDTEGEDKQKTKNRKRILETSADSDSDTANPAQKEKKLKVQSATMSMQHAIKKKLFSTTKIQVKKRRLIDPLKKVKDLLKEKRVDLNMSIPDELKTVEDNIEKESSKENKKPMSITSVTDAIEAVLKQIVDEDYDKNQNKPPADVTPSPVLSQNKIDVPPSQPKEKENKQALTRLEKEEAIKLPENLPADIEAIVSKLKEAALNYKGEGKKAFFTKDVNALLLNIEKRSKSLSKSSRVRVYEHLSQYVNCTKDTLTRRARILDLEDNERRLRCLQVKLKDAVDAIMPALQANFEQESQKILQRKFSKESANNEELKALKMPRRKFPWSEETKKLLKDVLSVKKRCLILEGKHKDNLLEEQVVDYLRTQILPFWPEGWMYLNIIKKILNRMQDNSKSSISTVNTNSPNSSTPTNTQKHSNLSITPVTNGKSNSEKAEITNSITVTKVVNNSDITVGDSSKISAKNSERNHVIAGVSMVKEADDKNVAVSKNEMSKSDIYKEYINKHSKSHELLPKVEPQEKSSDLSIHAKKNDVFKPYIEESSLSQAKKLVSDIGKPQNYQKLPKQNEMFKPYADEVVSVDRSIPEKVKMSTYEENLLARAEMISQYPERDKHVVHSYPDKEKLSSHSYSEKEKQVSAIHFEKDKYGSHTYSAIDEQIAHMYSDRDKRTTQTYSEKDKQTYSEKDKHSSRPYSGKDKHSSLTYSEKDKHSSHGYSDKDKYSSNAYSDKDKHSSHTYSEKDKPSSYTYSEKDKHSFRTYSEKDKHSSHMYSEKDKHGSHAYSDKDKHGSHAYSDKDKHGAHAYSDKDRHISHSYTDKDKHSSQAYSDKDKQSSQAYYDKDKHSSRSYSDKDKHSSHAYFDKSKHNSHSYSDKDKRNSYAYSDKDKHSSQSYSEKDKHSSQSYSEKDKHSSVAYSDKDKHSSPAYSDKDKHSSPAYSDKDKHSSPAYSDKDKHSSPAYSDKDKHSSQGYSDKDKHSSQGYSDKDKHSSQGYSDKDKHSSQGYSDKDKHSSQAYSDKDKHSSQGYSEKDMHHASHLDNKFEEKPLQRTEITPQLDHVPHTEKPSNLTKPLEKASDLAKFQMFKPYSDTPISHSDDSSTYKSKDLSKHHKYVDYKSKEEKHHRPVDNTKSISQDSTNFATKFYTTPSDFMSSRYDVSSAKHRSANTHSFPGGNVGNDISSVKEESGVIVKNEKITREDKKDHHIPVIPKASHCQGPKRKLLETYSRNSTDINPSNYFPVAVNKHTDYTSTPLVTTKSEGDGQKDIQMVMENLKALQKLSCSPIKSDNSSSPVSVIAYNKNFTTPKTTTAGQSQSRNDVNSRGDFSTGFQEEFQKAFINSFQQMTANNASNNKSGYNNGS